MTPPPRPLSRKGRGGKRSARWCHSPQRYLACKFSPLSPRGRGVGGEGAPRVARARFARGDFASAVLVMTIVVVFPAAAPAQSKVNATASQTQSAIDWPAFLGPSGTGVTVDA